MLCHASLGSSWLRQFLRLLAFKDFGSFGFFFSFSFIDIRSLNMIDFIAESLYSFPLLLISPTPHSLANTFLLSVSEFDFLFLFFFLDSS